MKDAVFLSLGLLLLFTGSYFLVRSIKSLSLYLKLKPLFLSLVLLGFVSSAPELFVTLNASFKGLSSVALGNVLGSNIINVLLVLGLAGLFHNLSGNPQLIRLDMPFLISGMVLLGFFVIDQSLSFFESSVLLVLFLIYIVILFQKRRDETEAVALEPEIDPEKNSSLKKEFSINESKTQPLLTSPKKIQVPTHCPACQTTVKEQGDYLVCPNEQCPAVKLNKWIHFASKKAMNIDFLGPKSIEKFSDLAWLKSYSDIYDLPNKNIKELEGFGEKSYQLLKDNLEKSKKVSLKKFLFALGIPLVGEETAEKISNTIYEKQSPLDLLSALHLLKNLSTEELEAIPDVGPLVAQSFKKAFENPELIADITALKEKGVTLMEKELKSEKLKDISFVITGTLPIPRSVLKEKIETEGGRFSSQLSTQTKYLIIGEKAGSKKEKAQKLGTTILSYEELLKRFPFLAQ